MSGEEGSGLLFSERSVAELIEQGLTFDAIRVAKRDLGVAQETKRTAIEAFAEELNARLGEPVSFSARPIRTVIRNTYGEGVFDQQELNPRLVGDQVEGPSVYTGSSIVEVVSDDEDSTPYVKVQRIEGSDHLVDIVPLEAITDFQWSETQVASPSN